MIIITDLFPVCFQSLMESGLFIVTVDSAFTQMFSCYFIFPWICWDLLPHTLCYLNNSHQMFDSFSDDWCYDFFFRLFKNLLLLIKSFLSNLHWDVFQFFKTVFWSFLLLLLMLELIATNSAMDMLTQLLLILTHILVTSFLLLLASCVTFNLHFSFYV